MTCNEINFENSDKLNRKNLIENIMKTIDNYQSFIANNHALVVSLDSPWGTGKSFLIKMWDNMIKSNNKYDNYYTIYYNAWENDDWNNPFIPFLSCIKKEYSNIADEEVKLFFERADAFLKSFGFSIVKDCLTKLVGEKTTQVISEALLDVSQKEFTDDYCKEYLNYLIEKDKFCDGIKHLIPANGKLIIFVDELDRCRPDFAIQTLEIIKHFFYNKEIVFIIAVDMLQLSYSISTVYGYGMDSVGYLRRFIDMSFSIPKPNIEDYVKCKFIPLLQSETYIEIMPSFLDTIVYMYNKLKLSLRDIDKISNVFITFLLFYKDRVVNHKEAMEIYLYFLILKYKYPKVYDLVVYKKFVLSSDETPNKLPVLEDLFVVNGIVMNLLKKIRIKGAFSYTGNYIKDFNLFNDKNTSVNLAEHIEHIIELFC